MTVTHHKKLRGILYVTIAVVLTLVIKELSFGNNRGHRVERGVEIIGHMLQRSWTRKDKMSGPVNDDAQSFDDFQKRKRIKICHDIKQSFPATSRNNLVTRLTNDSLKSFTNIYFLEKLKVIYCNVPGVDDLPWKRHVLMLAGIIEPTDVITLYIADELIARHFRSLSSQPLGDVRSIINTYKKVVFVAHPFTRLIFIYESLYRNSKQIDTNSQSSIDQYKGHKKNLPKPQEHNLTLSFEAFLHLLLEANSSTLPSEINRIYSYPIHKVCSPCLLIYDFVGRQETFKKDHQHILDDLKLSNLIKDEIVSDGSGVKAFFNVPLLRKYYQPIDDDDLFTLYEKFDLDFEIFKYSFEDFLTIVKEE